jgi:hypothetical protein
VLACLRGHTTHTELCREHDWSSPFSGRLKDSRLSLGDHQLAGIASYALGNAITFNKPMMDGIEKAVIKMSSSALGAVLGTVLEPGGGTLAGYAIGVLIESAASWAFEWFTSKTIVRRGGHQRSDRNGRADW